MHSLSQQLMGRYFAVLLATSGIVSALVHVLPNLTGMTWSHRLSITIVCIAGALAVWWAPWDRWPRSSLYWLPPVGFGVKLWANLLGGLGPYSFSIHFVLIYVWMGLALPRWAPTAFAPMLAVAYVVPLMMRGDAREYASVALVAPICVVIGESVAWISNRLRDVERVDGQRMWWMRWLLEASGGLAHQHDRDETAAYVLQLATQVPSAEGAAVLLPAPGRHLEVVASLDWPGTLPKSFHLPDFPALIEAMQDPQILGANDDICREFGELLGVPRLGIAPMFGSSRSVGVALIARSDGAMPLDSFTQDLLSALAMQAGLAFERVRDRETLVDESLRDELTGLGNRRKASVRLERLAPGDAVALVDLDHFKQVNDTHGHAAGDEVLRDLGEFLSATLRDRDEAFRMGGEEFLIVLEQSGEKALTAAERFCERWREQAPLTTFSAGVAIHLPGRTPDATLARADFAMYEAKRLGRDQVALEPSRFSEGSDPY